MISCQRSHMYMGVRDAWWEAFKRPCKEGIRALAGLGTGSGRLPVRPGRDCRLGRLAKIGPLLGGGPGRRPWACSGPVLFCGCFLVLTIFEPLDHFPRSQAPWCRNLQGRVGVFARRTVPVPGLPWVLPFVAVLRQVQLGRSAQGFQGA